MVFNDYGGYKNNFQIIIKWKVKASYTYKGYLNATTILWSAS